MIKNIRAIENSYQTQEQNQIAPKTLDPRQLSFEAMLNERLAHKEEQQEESVLQVSKHASHRMAQRGMHLSTELMLSLNEAVEKVRNKGAKDTVMIAKEGAFIINVPNNVIVTAITQEELKDNVFTNIDSAVLI